MLTSAEKVEGLPRPSSIGRLSVVPGKGWAIVVGGKVVCGPTWTMHHLAAFARSHAITLNREETAPPIYTK